MLAVGVIVAVVAVVALVIVRDRSAGNASDLADRSWRIVDAQGPFFFTEAIAAHGNDFVVLGRNSLTQTSTAYVFDARHGDLAPTASSAVLDAAKQAVAWTPAGVFAWGGESTSGAGSTAGAMLDTKRRSWRPISPSPLDARSNAAAVWTGADVVVWGGRLASSGPGGFTNFFDGARYDPLRDAWTPMAAPPLHLDQQEYPVWTGHEVVLIGDVDGAAPDTAVLGLAYNPTLDAWRVIPKPPGWNEVFFDNLAFGPQRAASDGTNLYVLEESGATAQLALTTLQWTTLPSVEGDCLQGNMLIADQRPTVRCLATLFELPSPRATAWRAISTLPDGVVNAPAYLQWTNDALAFYTTAGKGPIAML